jgi:hypothetical protein
MPQLYSHGNPTNAEQLMLELLNRARADPAKEAMRLEINLQTGTKVDARGKPVKPIADAPMAPLPFNSKLMKAAGDHAQWLLQHPDGFGGNVHVGEGGLNLAGRIEQVEYFTKGTDKGAPQSGENIAHDFNAGAAFAHDGLFLDPNPDADAGHRRTMLGDWDEVGIGGHGNEAVEDFVFNWLAEPEVNPGLKRPTFILGVVYVQYGGGEAFYPGSGKKGVTVTLSQGDYYAVTSDSGGYAIPVDTVSGKVTVTFDWGAAWGKKTQIVEVNDRNVKVDSYHVFPAFLKWLSLLEILGALKDLASRLKAAASRIGPEWLLRHPFDPPK